MAMPNPNKQKGDRAERDVRKIISQYDPSARRTRPGRREDEGDILTDEFTIQVKNVKTARWDTWLTEWDQQQKRSGKPHKILVWRRAGAGGREPRFLAVMDLIDLLETIGGSKQHGDYPRDR